MVFFFIGHRGTRKSIDENTDKAFETAIKAGANYVEFDIRKTKDNQFIIFHDETLDRTTNSSGYINSLTYKELNKYKTKINNQDIPLLVEVLRKYKDKTKFMIELKEKGIQENVLDIIIKSEVTNKCIISGRSINDLLDIKKRGLECLICYNITKGKELTLEDFLKEGEKKRFRFLVDMISLRSNQITERFINICHMNNILALSWDFIKYEDPLVEIKKIISMGIDGVLFDDYNNISLIRNWMDNIGIIH